MARHKNELLQALQAQTPFHLRCMDTGSCGEVTFGRSALPGRNNVSIVFQTGSVIFFTCSGGRDVPVYQYTIFVRYLSGSIKTTVLQNGRCQSSGDIGYNYVLASQFSPRTRIGQDISAMRALIMLAQPDLSPTERRLCFMFIEHAQIGILKPRTPPG